MTTYIEAPAMQVAHGGLLRVANVIDVTNPRAEGVTYLSEACGTAAIVPGDICGMTTATISQSGTTLTVALTHAPAGRYSITWDGPGAPVTNVVRGPNPVTTFTVTAGAAQTVDITSDVGIARLFTGLTLPLATPVVVEFGEKTFQPITTVAGKPFTVYKGVNCDYLGEDQTLWAEKAFGLGEGRAVEEGVLRQILATASAVDLTPGTVPTIRRGISLLEGYAALAYGGVPTLHVSHTVTSLALTDGVFRSTEDFVVSSKQGAKVANGGGYEDNLGPTGAVAAAGEAWVYISGTVTLVRDSVASYRALEWEKNSQFALAERTYTPLVECFVAATRVKLENTP